MLGKAEEPANLSATLLQLQEAIKSYVRQRTSREKGEVRYCTTVCGAKRYPLWTDDLSIQRLSSMTRVFYQLAAVQPDQQNDQTAFNRLQQLLSSALEIQEQLSLAHGKNQFAVVEGQSKHGWFATQSLAINILQDCQRRLNQFALEKGWCVTQPQLTFADKQMNLKVAVYLMQYLIKKYIVSRTTLDPDAEQRDYLRVTLFGKWRYAIQGDDLSQSRLLSMVTLYLNLEQLKTNKLVVVASQDVPVSELLTVVDQLERDVGVSIQEQGKLSSKHHKNQSWMSLERYSSIFWGTQNDTQATLNACLQQVQYLKQICHVAPAVVPSLAG